MSLNPTNTQRPSHRFRFVVTLASVAILPLALAACSNDSGTESGSDTSTPAMSTSAAPAPSTDPAPTEDPTEDPTTPETLEPEPSDEPTDPEPTVTPVANTEECLVGIWEADQQQFAKLFKEAGAKVAKVSGQVLVEFQANGKSKTHYNDWVIETKAEGQTVVIERGGVDTGTWKVSKNDILNMSDVKVGSTLTIDMGGQKMQIEPNIESLRDAPVVCDGDNLTVEQADGIMNLYRQS